MVNKKFLLVVIALTLIFVPACSYSSEYYSDGDVIVVLKSLDSNSVNISNFAASSGAFVKATYPSLSKFSKNDFVMLHSDSKDPEEFAKELLKDSNVVAASPNYKVYASALPNDTHVNECWGLLGENGIGAAQAWEISTGSPDVYVAVIDSGIDYNQPDLKSNIDTSLSRNIVNGSSYSATDDNGHGTHVAGIIGAKGNNAMGIAGVNWNVKLISIKALNSKGSGTIAGVINALDYIVDLISVQKVNIRAVNMSLETYVNLEPTHDNLVKFPLWRAFKDVDALNKAVITVAAGNYNETIGQPSTYAHDIVPGAGYYVYPASFKGLNNMLSVGALGTAGKLAEFSSKKADITAPGVDILSTWLSTSSNEYSVSDGVSLKSMAGTSMAAPFVAGGIALLASVASEDVTAYQLKKAILRDYTSSSSVKSSAETKLNLNLALEEYIENKGNEKVLPANPPASPYDDYVNYDTGEDDDDDDYDLGGDGGGGCNNTNIFAALMLVILCSLVKKLRS